MRRLARAAFAMAVVVAPVLGAHPAHAEDPGTLFTCPPTLGGLPLEGQEASTTQRDPWFGEHGASFTCGYWRDDPTLGDVRLSAGVIWEESAVDPERFYCRGDGRPQNDVGSNGEMILTLSTDRRAISFANQSTDYGGSHAVPIRPAVDLAAQMLPLAEARAAVCPGVSEGGDAPASGTSDGETGATPDAGTEAEPADAGGSDGSGAPLVVGGLIAAVVGGAGSLLLTKQGGGAVVDVAPPADNLFSGQEALDLLHDAGLIEPVLDAAGRPVGFKPLGDLQQMLDAASPWQPAFANPVATPDGGTATHLSGIAFEPGPDGTITSVTVAVRPGGAPASAPAPAPEPGQPPGLSLGDQLWVAGMEAAVRGVPIEAVLDGPIAPPVAPEPPSLADGVYVSSIQTSAEYLGIDGPIAAVTRSAPPAPVTAPTRPPVDPGRFDRWLTTPGPKVITPRDLHTLAPNSVGEDGSVKSGLYEGGRVTSTIADGVINVTVHAPDSTDSILDIMLPDIQVGGVLSTNGGRLAVDVQGHAPDSMVAKAVQKQLDGLNTTLSRAGMAVDQLQVTDGAINLNIVPSS